MMSSETSAAPRDEFMICAPNPWNRRVSRRVFFLPLREPSAADVQGDWRRATPPSDTWLHDMVHEIEANHAVPSSDPAIRHSILARDRFGDDWPAISRTLGWHYYRLYIGEAWSVRCSERATARVCSKLLARADAMDTSDVAWDDARELSFDDDAMPSEQHVRDLVDQFARDVDADEQLTAALHTRCGLGRTDASNWIVSRDPVWPRE